MDFRITKNDFGYVVEYQKISWSLFGLKRKWKPFITYAGSDTIFHYKERSSAMKDLLERVKQDTNFETIINTNIN